MKYLGLIVFLLFTSLVNSQTYTDHFYKPKGRGTNILGNTNSWTQKHLDVSFSNTLNFPQAIKLLRDDLINDWLYPKEHMNVFVIDVGGLDKKNASFEDSDINSIYDVVNNLELTELPPEERDKLLKNPFTTSRKQ